MRIGILTFHIAQNYGAVLQCYALQEVLKEKGYDVEIVDYRPQSLLNYYKIFNVQRLMSCNSLEFVKNIVREIIKMPNRFRRYVAFQHFINNKLNLSAKIKGRDIPCYYDVYIIGSDQVWNPKMTDGFDSIYFGNLNFTKGKKVYIAYAVSMEEQKLGTDDILFIKKSLNNFDFISVREELLAKFLNPLTDKDIKVVLDPTLLLNRHVWEIIAKRLIKKKYVLVYQTRTNSNMLKIANEIAENIDAVVVEVTASLFVSFSKNKIQSATPEEFVGLVKYASFVVTTSFHGTIFSVIFNRPFYCIELGDNFDTRSRSFLSYIGLDKRMIKQDNSISFDEIEYDNVNSRLLQLRKESIDYLTKSINKHLSI